jgi:hypothetical protein
MPHCGNLEGANELGCTAPQMWKKIMGYMVPGALLIVDHSTWKTSRHVAEHGGTWRAWLP